MKTLICTLLLLVANLCNSQCNTNPFVTYTVSANSGSDIYYPSGNPTWKGGDTLDITAASYGLIQFGDIHGDPCHPLVIRFKGTTNVSGQVRIKNDCSYLKIIGDPSGTRNVSCQTLVIEISNHIEASGFNCTGADIGIFVRVVPDSTDRRTYYDSTDPSGNYYLRKLTFHNFYIHDNTGEAMYIGSTSPNGNTYGGKFLIPSRLDSVEIYNCTIVNSGWDGIQVSGALNGCYIHDNTIYNYGTLDIGSQRAGIILGGTTNGSIYNNSVVKGTGNGVQVFGYGVINVYSNVIDSAGMTSGGEQSFISSNRVSTVESFADQQVNFYNNEINNPFGVAIKCYYENVYNDPTQVYSNTFCIPGAGPTWKTTNIVLDVPGSSETNNTLDCGTTPTNVICKL